MNKLTTFFLLLVITACTTDKQKSNVEFKNVAYNAPQLDIAYTVVLEPYTIAFKIEETETNEFNLVVSMGLYGGSHFVSPYSSDRFSGRFNISIEDNTHLALEDTFIETPRSVEIYDPHPFVKGLVNWVNINTSYNHQLQIKTQEDFEVKGMVSFTIEPSCTFEEIPFIIKYFNGKIRVELFQC